MTSRLPKSSLLVYCGKGSDRQSRIRLHNSLKQAVNSQHYVVKYVTAQEILEGSWASSCKLIAFGGGYDLGFEEDVGRKGTRKIRQFVEDGGSYLGMCAGAYWASDYIEFDKGGPLEVVGERFLKFYPGKCIGPAFPGFTYNSKEGVHVAPLQYKHLPPFGSYMHGGGFFVPPSSCWTSDSNPSVITPSSVECHTDLIVQTLTESEAKTPTKTSGQYNDNNHILKDRNEVLGSFCSLETNPCAVVKCYVGKGIAILSAVHLEFPASVLESEDVNLKPLIPKFEEVDNERDFVFRDILFNMGIKLSNAKPNL